MPSLPPPLTRIPSDVVALADYEPLARERLSPETWAYFTGGAADELTARWNREAFSRIRLQGRVLADLSGAHTRVTLFGHTYDYPILLAPVAFHKLAHPDGENATALGASAMRAGMVLSTYASVTLEEVAQVGPGPRWFHLGIQPDRGFVRELVQRVEASGYQAVVVTVDDAITSVRNRQARAGFRLPPGIEPVNLRGLPPSASSAPAGASPVFGSALVTQAPGWKDLDWIRSLTRLPVLVKGIMSPLDAALAVERGLSGVIVSNHGGRTLDTLPATIDALPRIADAIGGRVPLLVDGGIRRGTDVLKALALGAQAVLIGQPYIHALAAAGAVGVAHVLHILRAELETAMALTGCSTLDRIDRSVLWPD